MIGVGLDPGRRDTKMTIQAPVSTGDGMGGRSKTWTTLCVAWAEFKKPRAHTALVQGGVAMVASQEIVVPTVSGVTAGCRVVAGNRVYKVVAPGMTNGRYMSLLCEEVEHHAG